MGVFDSLFGTSRPASAAAAPTLDAISAQKYAPDPYAGMTHAAPQPGIMDDPNQTTATKVAAALMAEPYRMAAGLASVPGQAMDLARSASSPVIDEGQMAGMNPNAAGQALNIAATAMGGGMTAAEEGALGAFGGRGAFGDMAKAAQKDMAKAGPSKSPAQQMKEMRNMIAGRDLNDPAGLTDAEDVETANSGSLKLPTFGRYVERTPKK